MIYKFNKIKLKNKLCLKVSQLCHSKNLPAGCLGSRSLDHVSNTFDYCFSGHFPLKIMMRTVVFLLCTGLFSLTPVDTLSQNSKIVIEADTSLSIDEVFRIIKSQTSYSFVYHENLFKDVPNVHLKKGTIRLHKLLNESLPINRVDVIISKNNIILIREKGSQKTKFQQRSVSGIVTDQSGIPIPGVTVLIKGTNKGVTTNLEGQFTIKITDPAHVLVFSSLGFESQEKLVGDQTTINVRLKEKIDELQEVTIRAGYYNTSQRHKTGSISKIKFKEIEKQPVNSPMLSIQGRLSGVNITQPSGIPGGGFSIQIRGTNFLTSSSNRPLYIVDGVPFESESIGQGFAENIIPGAGVHVSPINSMNPSDIESIEVLKDADATAIYGSRGANGVVLITTKRGKAGKTRVKVTASSTLSNTILLDFMNTEQYLEMRLEGLTNDGYTLETVPNAFKNSAHDLYRWDQSRSTNWQKVLLGKTSHRHQAQLSFSGGSEQTQFLLSGGYQNETTVFPDDSNYGRASVLSTMNHQSVNKRLSLNVSTNYIVEDKRLPQNDLTRLTQTLAPNAPELYDEVGNLNWEENGGIWTNPLAALKRRYRAQIQTLLMNSVVSYRIFPWITFKANLGYTNYKTEQYRTFPNTARSPSTNNTPERSASNIGNASRESWIVEPQVNFQKTWGRASLNILLGTTFQHQKSNEITIAASNFPSNKQILNLSAAESVSIASDVESEYKYQSFFGRLNFKWDEKYIINLTGRRDGSSRFGPGRQFGDFGAIGLAWLFCEEGFLENSSVLSFGKLRSSYGITGSDGIGDYGFYDTYDIIGSENYDGSVLQATGLFNPDFGWEENKKFEVAIELGLFQDRIFFTGAWYSNLSSNQLVGIPLAGTTGFSSINANFDATVENSGFEVDVRSVNIQNEHVNWTTNFNLSIPKNKLVKFDGLEGSAFRDRYVLGKPLTILKLMHNLGIDPETGIYQFEDYNNDGEINREDRQWIEDTAPTFHGGLNNIINYKNWTLDVFMNFRKQRSTGDLSVHSFPPGSFNNQHVSALNRWRQVGDQALIQRYTAGYDIESGKALGNDVFSSRHYMNTSFIRLKNISLTYNLSENVISGFDASIYVQGQNLFYVYSKSKYASDPEQIQRGSSLRSLRQFTLGVQLSF